MKTQKKLFEDLSNPRGKCHENVKTKQKSMQRKLSIAQWFLDFATHAFYIANTISKLIHCACCCAFLYTKGKKNQPVTCGITPRSGCAGSLCAVEAWIAGPRWGRKANLSTVMARVTGLTYFFRNCP